MFVGRHNGKLMWKSKGYNTYDEAVIEGKLLWKDGASGIEYVKRKDKFYVFYR